ncbi:hypothetical protein V502_07415 [Pseudogymnoascus sp. VKM F-4520 (FW-2644)]|nr:hypothetical protein V502_07415 [Pseudogymnoascus sp. VKM F-4520 (FW-2644)]
MTDTQAGQSFNGNDIVRQNTSPPPEAPRKKPKEGRIAIDERRRAVRARVCEFKSTASRTNDPNSSPGGPSGSNTLAREQRSRILRDRARYMERILKHEIRGISLDTESLRVRAEAILGEGNRREGSADATDSSCDDELVIGDETCTIDPVDGDTATHYSGEFSYWNFSMRIKRLLEDRVQSPGNQTQYTDSNSDYIRATQLKSGPNNLSIAISCCPPRPIADFLLRIFFDFAETNYLYIPKSWLLEKLNIIYDNPTTLTIKDTATVSMILTVFAIGTQYAYLDSPKKNERIHTGLKYSEDEIGTMFYHQAIRLLPEIIEISTLESVQACLLFAVYVLPIDASGLGYIYINLALRLGMQNGMHRKYTGNALSGIMIEMRNRVWWSACVVERPLSMLRSDIDADLPQDREDMQTTELPSNVARESRKLSRNYQKQDIPSLSSRLLTIKNELATWWSNLDILQEKTDQQTHQTHHRSTMHLRLEFCLIRMFVGRPFLFGRQSARLNSPQSASNGQTTTPANNEKPMSSRQQLVGDCVQAAKEALEICHLLRDSGYGLARGSYIEYSSCRASLLVLIAHCVQTQSDEFQTTVQDGLVMIRDMSAAGDSARSEVTFIETLERTLKTRDDGNDVAPGCLGSGYDSFKRWESMLKSGEAAHPPREDLGPKTAGTVAVEPDASTSAWGSFAVPSNPIDHTTYDWPTSILSQTDSDNFFAMPDIDVNLAFNSSNDLGALFEGGDIRLRSNGSTFTAQGVDQFMANTEFDFSASGLVR